MISRQLERECSGLGLWMIEVVDAVYEGLQRRKGNLIYSIVNIDIHPIPTWRNYTSSN